MQNLGLFGEETITDAINRLKSKGFEFAQMYQRHLSLYDRVKNNPELLAKWTSIKKYADGVKATIQAINNSVDSTVNWLKDVFGFQSDNLQGLQGVGALPLIPIAYVLAAITALTYVIGEMAKFYTLVNMGATPSQLTQQSSTLSNVSSLIKWGGIAFGLYILYKKYGHHLKD